jgi:chromosomal replication initiation ATPase DnaA
MQQLLLDVTVNKKDKFLAEDFLPLANSFNAHRIALSSLANDLSGCLIMGPKGVGKTHLLNVCKQFLSNKDELFYVSDIRDLPPVIAKYRYLLVDNIDYLTPAQQETLFHWYNHIKENQGKMILVLDKTIDELVTLKDLKSRMLTLQQAILDHPNDKDLEIFILKQAFDRQIEITNDVLAYMILRIERDFKKAEKLMDKIDQESLREKRKITIPFIKEFLN